MPLRCVIVDDSPFIRMSLKNVITRLGHEVIELFGSGAEFLDQAGSIQFDLLFLDIILPELTGLEVLERLLELKPESRVIMLSGLAQNSVISSCLHIGALDFIIKPFDEEKLKDSLIVVESSIQAPDSESLTRVQLGSHLVNLYFQEIMAHSTTILRKLIKTQVESLIVSYRNEHDKIFTLDPENLNLSINSSSSDDFDEGQVYSILRSLIQEVRFELTFLYQDEFIENLFYSAYVTFCARPKIRQQLEQISPEILGLPEIPEQIVDAPYLRAASTSEELEASISVGYFVAGMMGPELLHHINEDIIPTEQMYKSAIFYYTMTNQGGSSNFQGLFGPLPVSTENGSSNLSALVYSFELEATDSETMPFAPNGLVVIIYSPVADKIASDYNKLTIIIKSRLGEDLHEDSEIDQAQIVGIRNDIVEYLSN